MQFSRGAENGASSGRARDANTPVTRIARQFRERLNMTYELDCGGVSLSLRAFPPDEVASFDWRVEARVGHDDVVTATGRTRLDAMREVRRSVTDRPTGALSVLDWDAVFRALESVRAL